MVRNDGDYVIYIIEKHSIKFDKWYGVTDRFSSYAECKDFSASGECWQRTGEHGVFDKEVAFKACNFLNGLNGAERSLDTDIDSFRVVEITISQHRQILVPSKY